MRIFGLILAGGGGTRMGGADKALMMLGGRSMLAHVEARFAPQVEALALSANGDTGRFASYGLPVLTDGAPGQGPLAGLVAGLDWAARNGADVLVTVAVDTPFLPCDLVPQLMFAAEGSGAALACSNGQLHPTFGLWPVTARSPARAALDAGERRLRQLAEGLGAGVADFPISGADPFLNVNQPEDMGVAETVLGA